MDAGDEAERRRDRLRVALRDNLKRRKARGRVAPPDAADGGGRKDRPDEADSAGPEPKDRD